jgi:hypothetical protein
MIQVSVFKLLGKLGLGPRLLHEFKDDESSGGRLEEWLVGYEAQTLTLSQPLILNPNPNPGMKP